MEYIKHCKQPQSGLNVLSEYGDGDMKLEKLSLLVLKDGESYQANSGTDEVALVILGGKANIQGDGFDFGLCGQRKNVFDGKPYCIYIPHHTNFQVKAVGDVDIAVAYTPSTLDTPAYVIKPDQVIDWAGGKGSYARTSYLVLTEKFPSAHMYIGEAFVEDGRHASFPPHRHEFDRLPNEVKMEEIYFFRYNPKGGYGIQKIYTDDRAIDVTYTVEENDTTLIPRGYHPVIDIPGYTMYYLWVMAGEVNRKFVSVLDPQHKWVVEQK
ncbi:MAG: 5-deoxy-glucuronate isomerase [Victivallales bacterium]|nr:5-deoxy-glucuronate isomerase [Victivallales bacterium]